MGTQATLAELLLSGFFAIACLRARPESLNSTHFAPHRLFMLTDRLERIRRTKWQWFAMVLLLVLIRLQMQAPVVVELTGLVQFLLFLALPTDKHAPEVSHRR